MNIYCVKPRGSNIGNEVIYLGTKHFLKGHNVIRVEKLDARTVYEINQYGDGVVVGGGNFYENNEVEFDMNALKGLERPMFLFSLSYGKVYNRYGELVRRTDCMPDEQIIALNKMASISTSRDIATHKYLDGLGCETIMCGCPTQFVNRFNLALPEVKEGRSLLFVRNPAQMCIPQGKWMDIVSDIRKIMGVDTLIACNDRRDIPFAEMLGYEYIYFDDVYEYLATIKSARWIASYRIHASIPALAFGVSVENMVYDERSESLINSLDEGNYEIIEGLFYKFLKECV